MKILGIFMLCLLFTIDAHSQTWGAYAKEVVPAHTATNTQYAEGDNKLFLFYTVPNKGEYTLKMQYADMSQTLASPKWQDMPLPPISGGHYNRLDMKYVEGIGLFLYFNNSKVLTVYRWDKNGWTLAIEDAKIGRVIGDWATMSYWKTSWDKNRILMSVYNKSKTKNELYYASITGEKEVFKPLVPQLSTKYSSIGLHILGYEGEHFVFSKDNGKAVFDKLELTDNGMYKAISFSKGLPKDIYEINDLVKSGDDWYAIAKVKDKKMPYQQILIYWSASDKKWVSPKVMPFDVRYGSSYDFDWIAYDKGGSAYLVYRDQDLGIINTYYFTGVKYEMLNTYKFKFEIRPEVAIGKKAMHILYIDPKDKSVKGVFFNIY